jgi:hypothetical protein
MQSMVFGTVTCWPEPVLTDMRTPAQVQDTLFISSSLVQCMSLILNVAQLIKQAHLALKFGFACSSSCCCRLLNGSDSSSGPLGKMKKSKSKSGTKGQQLEVIVDQETGE